MHVSKKGRKEALCTLKRPRLGNPVQLTGVAALLRTPDLSFILVESLEGGRRMAICPLTPVVVRAWVGLPD